MRPRRTMRLRCSTLGECGKHAGVNAACYCSAAALSIRLGVDIAVRSAWYTVQQIAVESRVNEAWCSFDVDSQVNGPDLEITASSPPPRHHTFRRSTSTCPISRIMTSFIIASLQRQSFCAQSHFVTPPAQLFIMRARPSAIIPLPFTYTLLLVSGPYISLSL